MLHHGHQACEVVGRDLLDGVPAGHDGYLLKRVLHNWDDAMAGRILASCRAAMSSPASRLIVVDQVVPERVQPSPLTEAMLLMDTLMLAKHGGRQRGRSEFEALLAGADLRLTDAVAGAARFAVLEAVARE